MRSLAARMHLGTPCENMRLHIDLIMYLCETVYNELWLGTGWWVVGFSFVLAAKRKLM